MIKEFYDYRKKWYQNPSFIISKVYFDVVKDITNIPFIIDENQKEDYI